MNPGGPGVPTQEFLAGVSAGVPEAVAARYDLVTFDPRGVGASEGLTCGGPDLLVEATGDYFADQEAFGRALGAQCLAEDAALLDTMTSTDIARDLELVRAALGDERLTYLGFSWGTLLGGLYAELFPARVGRMVLDGAIDPNLGYLEEVRRSTIGGRGRCWPASSPSATPTRPAPSSPTGPRRCTASWPGRRPRGELSSPDGRTLSLEQLYSATYAALAAGRSAFPIFAEWLLEAAQGDPTQLIDLAEAYAGGLPGGAVLRHPLRRQRRALQPGRDPAGGLRGARPRRRTSTSACSSRWAARASPSRRPPGPAVAVGRRRSGPGPGHRQHARPGHALSGCRRAGAALGGSRLLTFEGEGHTIAFQGVDCVDDGGDRLPAGRRPAPAWRRCARPPRARPTRRSSGLSRAAQRLPHRRDPVEHAVLGQAGEVVPDPGRGVVGDGRVQQLLAEAGEGGRRERSGRARCGPPTRPGRAHPAAGGRPVAPRPVRARPPRPRGGGRRRGSRPGPTPGGRRWRPPPGGCAWRAAPCPEVYPSGRLRSSAAQVGDAGSQTNGSSSVTTDVSEPTSRKAGWSSTMACSCGVPGVARMASKLSNHTTVTPSASGSRPER